jgi:folate-binding protein YgfZ
MTKLRASSVPYSSISLDGPAAWDYGQRLFSRDLRRLSVNSCTLTLFLTADGKIQNTFWTVKKPSGLQLICESRSQNALLQTIEKYHFSENFEAKAEAEIFAYWRPHDPSTEGLDQAADQYFGFFRNTDFVFQQAPRTDAYQSSPELWHQHRIENLIPDNPLDYDDSHLVFDLGFEELCDPDKGCYIGQEIVERVRNRGGQGNRRLALMSWTTAPTPKAAIYDDEMRQIGMTTGSIVISGSKIIGLGFVKRGISEGAIRTGSENHPTATGHILRAI